MKRIVSVDKAIRTGRLLIIPLLLTFALGCLIVVAIYQHNMETTLGWFFLILFLFGPIIFSGLIAAFLTYIWQYWAFGNVRNVHELKKRALTLGFITEKGRFLRKVENSTEKDKKHWKIKQKFLQNDIFVDDLSVPSETHIYHSKALIYFFLFIAVFTIVGLVYVFTNNILIIGIATLIVVMTFLQLNRNKLKREQPQITLSNKGIETISTGFTSWKNIQNEQVYIVRAGKNTKYYLKYRNFGRQETVLLTGLNIGDGRMAELLILYRNRYELQNK